MKKIFAAFFLIGISSPLQALDLTPHEATQSGDGPPMKRYFFQDEGKRLSFRIDSKMVMNGGGAALGFRFSDLKGAAMKMSHSSMTPAVPFDEKNAEIYRATAQNLLATDAANVLLEEEQPNAISINGWTSRQYVFTFDLFDRPYRRSITFLNFNEKDQLIIDVSAEAADYEKAYARGFRLLNSLSDLPVDASGPT